MVDRLGTGEVAVLVHLDIGAPSDPEDVAEFRQLAESAGALPVGLVTGARHLPDSRLFVGSGKAEEIRALVAAEGAELVIFDHPLSPSQERNLERLLKCRVVDRTGLILDIFAQRARSFEGKLQVELAQLRHLSTRLIRGWTHLERQKGGIGLRGPGETQLESDRRLLGQRIAQLNKRLTRVAAQRDQSRRARRKALLPAVSLVGYTNAGKSTLFNRLTASGVFAADQLFATLDPTLRRVELGGRERVILADTVGFINHLPHELVAAFRSTLEETAAADVLLHVVDASNPRRALCMQHVNEVLAQIGADRIPQIEVYNKIDLLPDAAPRAERDAGGLVKRVWLSAHSGAGIDLMRDALGGFFRGQQVRKQVRLGPMDGRLRACLFQAGRVLSDRKTEDGGWELEVELERTDYERLLRQERTLEQRLIA